MLPVQWAIYTEYLHFPSIIPPSDATNRKAPGRVGLEDLEFKGLLYASKSLQCHGLVPDWLMSWFSIGSIQLALCLQHAADACPEEPAFTGIQRNVASAVGPHTAPAASVRTSPQPHMWYPRSDRRAPRPGALFWNSTPAHTKAPANASCQDGHERDIAIDVDHIAGLGPEQERVSLRGSKSDAAALPEEEEVSSQQWHTPRGQQEEEDINDEGEAIGAQSTRRIADATVSPTGAEACHQERVKGEAVEQAQQSSAVADEPGKTGGKASRQRILPVSLQPDFLWSPSRKGRLTLTTLNGLFLILTQSIVARGRQHLSTDWHVYSCLNIYFLLSQKLTDDSQQT